MAKRKTTKHKYDSSSAMPAPFPSQESTGRDRTDNSNPRDDAGTRAPHGDKHRTWVQSGMSLLIVLHFSVLLIALSANLAPSYLQGRVLEVLSVYLNATHQSYNALPLELTHSESLDFPLHVELLPQEDQRQTNDQVAVLNWQPAPMPGLLHSSSDLKSSHPTRWPNLARWLMMVANHDSESEVLSDFAARCVALAEKQTGQRFHGIRLVSPKVLSYDEDIALVDRLRDSNDEDFQPLVVYRAEVVRLAGDAGTERLSLVPAQPNQRTAKPASKNTEPSSKNTEPSSKNTEPASKNTEPASKNTEPASKNSEPASKNTEPASKNRAQP